jgi:hypothetical protein
VLRSGWGHQHQSANAGDEVGPVHAAAVEAGQGRRINGGEAGPLSINGDEAGPLSINGDEAGPLSINGGEAGPLSINGGEAGPLSVTFQWQSA